MDGLLISKNLEYSNQLIKSLETMIEIKDRFLFCYKCQKRPTERLFSDLEKTKKKIKILNEKLERI